MHDKPIELSDSNRVVRIRIGMYDSDCPFLSLSDKDGHERVILNLAESGHGSLSFYTGVGQPVLSIGMTSDTDAGMAILDPVNDAIVSIDLLAGVGKIRLRSNGSNYSWP